MGGYGALKPGAAEILITPKRTQRSNTGCVSHLREPGTASSNGQEQNGFHLALLSATVGNCRGNTGESISQLVNAQECQLVLAPRTRGGRVIAFLIQTQAAALCRGSNGFDSCARAQCQTLRLAL